MYLAREDSCSILTVIFYHCLLVVVRLFRTEVHTEAVFAGVPGWDGPVSGPCLLGHLQHSFHVE